LTSRPGRFTPFYPGFAGLNVFEKNGENWYRRVEHRRRKQCALRNAGVTIHKTVKIVHDLNTLTPLNNEHIVYNEIRATDIAVWWNMTPLSLV
jgi:hypothetical protein